MIDSIFQDKLMGALKDAVSSYNNGVTPTNAVIKSAQQHNFNIDQTQRLVETFNTARTIHHFKKYAQQDNKIKEFELADSDQVVLALFNKPEIKAAQDINSEYTQAPRNYNNPDFELPPIKTAEFNDTDLNTQITRAQKYIRSVTQLIKEASDQAATAVNKADLIIESLASLLKLGTVDVCKDRCNRLFLSMMDTDACTASLTHLNEKLPKHMIATQDELSKYGSVVDDRDLKTYQNSIKEAGDLFRTALELTVDHNNLVKSLNEFKDEFNKSASAKEGSSSLESFFLKSSQLFPGQFSDPSVASIGTSNEQARREQPKPAPVEKPPRGDQQGGKPEREQYRPAKSDGTSDILKGLFNAGIADKAQGGIGDLFANQTLTDNRQISERLRNLHRTTILEDLIINDPVISEVDPKVTAQAYNTILELAPEVSLSKEVVRAILRQSVHALAVSPFDAASWVDLEKKIKETQGTLPPQKKFPQGGK